jgi:hypothetical protein
LLTDTEFAQQQLEQTQAQVLQAAQNLLATGMDLTEVTQLLGLTETQVETLRLD